MKYSFSYIHSTSWEIWERKEVTSKFQINSLNYRGGDGGVETLSTDTYEKSWIGVLKVYHIETIWETELGACQKGKTTIFFCQKHPNNIGCPPIIYLNVDQNLQP